MFEHTEVLREWKLVKIAEVLPSEGRQRRKEGRNLKKLPFQGWLKSSQSEEKWTSSQIFLLHISESNEPEYLFGCFYEHQSFMSAWGHWTRCACAQANCTGNGLTVATGSKVWWVFRTNGYSHRNWDWTLHPGFSQIFSFQLVIHPFLIRTFCMKKASLSSIINQLL